MNDLTAAFAHPLFKDAQEDREKRMREFYALLAGQITRYTRGESCSVPVETAQHLTDSLLYTIALNSREVPLSPDMPLGAAFREGRAKLDQSVKKARRLYYLVQKTALPVDLPCYREAIEGISGFFSAYDPEFCAHETPGDFDYPLSLSCEESGITWMLHYLNTMYWENVFCLRFSPNEIEEALRAQGLWGMAVPVNLFETVCTAALFKSLLPDDPMGSLAVSREEVSRLLALLTPLSPADIVIMVQEACGVLIRRKMIESAPLKAMLYVQADALALRLKPAVKQADLSVLFPALEAPPPALFPLEGEPLDAEVFRALAAELSACRFLADKLLILTREVHSLSDLIGLMEAGCFPVSQLNRVFSLLRKEELAALMRMGPSCFRLQGQWVFPAEGELQADASTWEKGLYGYVAALAPGPRREITQLAQALFMP